MKTSRRLLLILREEVTEFCGIGLVEGIAFITIEIADAAISVTIMSDVRRPLLRGTIFCDR